MVYVFLFILVIAFILLTIHCMELSASFRKFKLEVRDYQRGANHRMSCIEKVQHREAR